MTIDKRQYPRLNPIDLLAKIKLTPAPPGSAYVIEGVVVDLSYSGVKIKLFEGLSQDISENSIKIFITLPDSGVELTINGVLKHLGQDAECGFKFSAVSEDEQVDELMFECIKRQDKPIDSLNAG